jgi:hypothetical protein
VRNELPFEDPTTDTKKTKKFAFPLLPKKTTQKTTTEAKVVRCGS